ncbi:MAG: hypothetical protein AAB535_03030 [Patescibacteria group bacterium]
MNKFQKALASALATGAILANTVLPVLAQTTIVISGNGTNSDNTSNVSFTQSTTVVQSNVADVNNDVYADADTGDNDAKDNTGGDVSIKTGDADVDVNVENTLNSNSAQVDCCQGGDTEILISGNGSDTDNDANVTLDNSTTVFQDNYADVTNKVDAYADTGDNDAKDNTGGSVSIDTGDAETSVTLATTANANSATVGGSGSGSGGSLSVRILGNGTNSDNTINLALLGSLALIQGNVADVLNDVYADADTGNNDAKDNTGGEVSIETGDASVDVSIDNMVNFNWADADCGCLLSDLLVKIADNGSDTDNDINATLGSLLTVFQGNCAGDGPSGAGSLGDSDCGLDNIVDAYADTGDNKAKDNTGDPGDDPSVVTGDASTGVEIENSGNSNVYGAVSEWELPEWDFNFNFSFDLSDLLDWLSDHS